MEHAGAEGVLQLKVGGCDLYALRWGSLGLRR